MSAIRSLSSGSSWSLSGIWTLFSRWQRVAEVREPGRARSALPWSEYGLEEIRQQMVAAEAYNDGWGGPPNTASPLRHVKVGRLIFSVSSSRPGSPAGESAAQLGYYLDEFTFRFNRRNSHRRGLPWYRLLQQAVSTDPHPYRDLIARASHNI